MATATITPPTQTAEVSVKGKDMNFNSLAPISSLSKRINPFQEAKVLMVYIDSDPSAGEVYPQSGGFALTKVGLNKLASAAGLSISSRIVSTSRDYVCAEASAKYCNGSGVVQEAVGTYEIDMDVIEEEIMSRPKKKEWDTPEKRKGEVLTFKKYKLQRAESGAINRVIRSILSVKNVYSEQELKQPFAVPHVHFSPDFSDPDIKRAAISRMSNQVNELYGGEVSPPAIEPSETPQQLEAPREDKQPEAEVAEASPAAKEEIKTDAPAETGAKNTEEDEYLCPPCPTCGGETEYRTGVSPKTNKRYHGSFCKETNCKGVEWGIPNKVDPNQKTIDEEIPAEAFVEQPDF